MKIETKTIKNEDLNNETIRITLTPETVKEKENLTKYIENIKVNGFKDGKEVNVDYTIE